MRTLEELSLEELNAIIFQIDEDLVSKKRQRHELVLQKTEKLEEEYDDSDNSYEIKSVLLDEYKEELNETLGINILRNQRDSVKEAIWEKEKQIDETPSENYMA